MCHGYMKMKIYRNGSTVHKYSWKTLAGHKVENMLVQWQIVLGVLLQMLP